MDLFTIALLLATGTAGGVATAIVGGATLITFPALLAAGLPPIVANASNAAAVTPASLFAAAADLGRLPALNKGLAALAILSVIGSAAGAALLLLTPDQTFTALVPALIGAATLSFASAGRIRRWLDARQIANGASAHGRPLRWSLLPLAVYGGYFGAGMSVVLLALLSLQTPDYRTANVVKNALSALISFVAVVIFIVQDMVAWGPTLIMMLGAMSGGYLGGWLASTLPEALVRAVVIAVGIAMTLVYAWRYWF